MKSPKPLPLIGWREWVALPELDLPSIKAKVDTGARTSSLHAFDVEIFRHRGAMKARFSVHPIQRDTHYTVDCEEDVVEERWVTSSTGHRTRRPVIVTPIRSLEQAWEIELTLVNRDAMGFRMLLGREAIRGRFVVDPGKSFLIPDNIPPRKRKSKPKATHTKNTRKKNPTLSRSKA